MSQNSHMNGQPEENWMLPMKYFDKVGQVIRRLGERVEIDAGLRAVGFLPVRARYGVVDALDDPIGGVPEFADVQDVDLRVVVRAGGDAGTAEDGDLAVRPGPGGDRADGGTLHVHAREKDRIGPFEMSIPQRFEVLIHGNGPATDRAGTPPPPTAPAAA